MKKIACIAGRTIGVLGLLCGLASVPLTFGLTGCSSPQHELLDDEAITARVRRALNEDQVYKYDRVNVVTDKGVVQLSGFTSTSTQKNQAEQIAKQIQGVLSVDNRITVKD